MKNIVILILGIVLLSYCKKQDDLRCEKPQSSELKDYKKVLKVTLQKWSGEQIGCGLRIILEDTFLISNNKEFRELKPFYLPDSIITMGLLGGDPVFEAELLFTGNDFECLDFRSDPKPPNYEQDTLILPEVRVLSIFPL